MHKLTVNIIEDVKDPLSRKYTLTHSDETGMRFLFIGLEYAEEEFDVLRDEVVAHFDKSDDNYILKVICPLSCAESKYSSDERLAIFKRHMPRVLKAIIGGDLAYISSTHGLLEAESHIHYCYYERQLNQLKRQHQTWEETQKKRRRLLKKFAATTIATAIIAARLMTPVSAAGIAQPYSINLTPPDRVVMLEDGVTDEIDTGERIFQLRDDGTNLIALRVGREVYFVNDEIELWIDNNLARVNGEFKLIDPTNDSIRATVLSNRTMVPVRFVAETSGSNVFWDEITKTITVKH